MNLAKIGLLSESYAERSIGSFTFDEGMSISEAISTMESELSVEGLDIVTESAFGQEILIEAAIFNRDKVDTLSEAIGASFIAKIKQWYENAVKFIKGIVEKIKQQIALNTKNKSKFLSVVRPLINKKKADTFEYSGYKWDSKFLANPAMDLEAVGGKAQKVFTEIQKEYQKHANRNATPTMLAKISKEAGFNATGTHTLTDEYIRKDIGKQLGIAMDAKELKEELRKAAGLTEKVTIKGFDAVSVDAMMSFIEKSADTDQAIKKTYETIEKELKAIVDALKKIGDTQFKRSEKDSDEAADKQGALWTKYWAPIKADIEKYRKSANVTLSIMGTYNNVCSDLNNTATKEFMRALKSFAGAKVTKK